MILHSINLKNILSFGPNGQELSLRPLNVLIGPNGSGKSNLIEAIALLRAAPGSLQETIRKGGGIANWIWRGEPDAQNAQLVAEVSPSSTSLLRYELCFLEANQRLRIHHERLSELSQPESSDTIPIFDVGSDELKLLFKDSGDLRGRRTQVMPAKLDRSVFSLIKGPEYPEITSTGERLEQIRLYREGSIGRRIPLRFPQAADLPNDELLEDGTNLGLVLNRLKRDHPSAADRVLNELRNLYEGIEAIDVSIQGGTVQLFLREGDITVPATQLSDGTLRYVCLLAVLCHPEPPPLICLEQPEMGLHPDLISGLSELLRDASERTQLIVTTHSDVLVDCFTDVPECVVICEKHEQQTQMQRLNSCDLSHWLAHYRLGELWSSGQLGGNRW